ncbi:MAG: Restriction endonuclease [Bacilli bacterium]|nr:Restriction endonuclease [Bacilli bacterium]
MTTNAKVRIQRLIDLIQTTYDASIISLPHANNLLHKLKRSDSVNENKLNAFEIIIPQYIQFPNTFINPEEPLSQRFASLVENLNNYLTTLKLPECDIFPHQADFASSVIPEMFNIIFKHLILAIQLPFEVSSQRDVVVDCMFDTFDDGRMLLKKKSIDVAILLPCELQFNGNIRNDFFVPLVALEIKTNMDKNMISGIEHSVETLKRTFPKCLYIAVAELADFAIEQQNYSTTYIDEIYILRKQKRSNVRSGAQERNLINMELVSDLATRVDYHLRNSSGEVPSLHERMNLGSLIRRRGINT